MNYKFTKDKIKDAIWLTQIDFGCRYVFKVSVWCTILGFGSTPYRMLKVTQCFSKHCNFQLMIRISEGFQKPQTNQHNHSQSQALHEPDESYPLHLSSLTMHTRTCTGFITYGSHSRLVLPWRQTPSVFSIRL